MAMRFLIIFILIFSTSKAYAEVFDPAKPQNFYVEPFKFNDDEPANDITDMVRNNFPASCKLKEINDVGADYIIRVDFINVKAEPMANDNELFEASLSISMTYSLTGSSIKEKSFKSAIFTNDQDEQDFVYNLVREMIDKSSSAIFDIMCKEDNN